MSLFIFPGNNIRLTPLNLYWQVEIINIIPVSTCCLGRGRCVYNDPKLVIRSPGYRSRLALIYRIIIQRPQSTLLVISRAARHDVYVERTHLQRCRDRQRQKYKVRKWVLLF